MGNRSSPRLSQRDLAEFKSSEDVRNYIEETNNWGRWGQDDQRGTSNLITSESQVAAARLVREGFSVSLSRALAVSPGPDNPRPVHHYTYKEALQNGGGFVYDYFSVACHGRATTHIDALTHVWNEEGKLYNGADIETSVKNDGATWGTLDQWRDGIFTRGVLLDVPAFRSTAYVTTEDPVMAEELEQIAQNSGIDLRPGDALVVYSGRERWVKEHGPWTRAPRPGLDISCIKFLRLYDCSALVWDMTERAPLGLGLDLGIHVAIPAYGLILIDSADLEKLSDTCKRLKRNDFLLTINPLYLNRGTGSPVNPVAIF